MSTRSQAVLSALRTLSRWSTLSQIATSANVSPQHAAIALGRLVDAKQVEVDTAGTPCMWRLRDVVLYPRPVDGGQG